MPANCATTFKRRSQAQSVSKSRRLLFRYLDPQKRHTPPAVAEPRFSLPDHHSRPTLDETITDQDNPDHGLRSVERRSRRISGVLISAYTSHAIRPEDTFISSRFVRAGEEIRTPDLQLGKMSVTADARCSEAPTK